MSQLTLNQTNTRSIDQLQTALLTLAEEVTVLKANVRGLQGLIKDHLQIREECPHKIRV